MAERVNRERELLSRVKVLLECSNMEPLQDQADIIIKEIQELLAQPEQRLTPLTPKLISLGNNCHESFIKGIRFAEKMHGIGGGE